MNILVTGSQGQLGSEIQRKAESNSHHYLFTDKEELDICRESEVRSFFENNSIDYIINCAAYTAVDKAEKEIDKALLVNATAPRILSEISHAYKAAILHISTDFVFDGRSCKPYVESDKTAPVNVYGQTKLEGETRLIKENPRHIIIRTSWLYSAYGRNFVRTMLKAGKEKKEINVISDQVGTPTYAEDLASVILTIVEKTIDQQSDANIWGIYHYSNEGVASWYDFAYEILDISGIKQPVRPVNGSTYPTPARRPHFSVLDKSKIKSTFMLEIPHWKESLANCLKRME